MFFGEITFQPLLDAPNTYSSEAILMNNILLINLLIAMFRFNI